MSEFSFTLINDDYQVGEGGRIQLALAIKTVKDRILTLRLIDLTLSFELLPNSGSGLDEF